MEAAPQLREASERKAREKAEAVRPGHRK